MADKRVWAVLGIACCPALALAAFDSTDVIQAEASATLLHDNNLFRLPDVDPRLFGVSPDRTSDNVRVIGVGLKVDKMLSRQRLIADVSATDSKYERNRDLDHVGYNSRLSWLWRFGNHWDGEIGFTRRRYLAGFADSRLTFKDLITSNRYTATAGYEFHPRWRIAIELNQRDWSHSAPSRRSSDFEGTGGALSVTYRTPANNSLGAEIRRAEGDYPNRETIGPVLFDNSYKEVEANALLAWRLSGALRLNAALGWTERTHENLSGRDFSGATGTASTVWEPTGKLRFTLTGTRDIRSFEDAISSYVLLNSLKLSPLWAISSKVAMQADLIYETREYLGDPGLVVAGASARDDTLRTARLGITYSPLRYVDLTLTYERGDRRSNQRLNDFDYESWFGTLRVRF